jgi:hypothetical protein
MSLVLRRNFLVRANSAKLLGPLDFRACAHQRGLPEAGRADNAFRRLHGSTWIRDRARGRLAEMLQVVGMKKADAEFVDSASAVSGQLVAGGRIRTCDLHVVSLTATVIRPASIWIPKPR